MLAKLADMDLGLEILRTGEVLEKNTLLSKGESRNNMVLLHHVNLKNLKN